MREVGHVLARADFRGNFHGARKKAAASRGIHEQIRLPATKPRRLCERFLIQPQSVFVHPLDLRPCAHALHAQFIGAFVEQMIERGARGVVGVGRPSVMAERLETKLGPVIHAKGERDARLVLANRRGALFQSQFPQHGHNRRNERLADD